MIKVLRITSQDTVRKTLTADLWADTKAEVTAEAKVEGLPDGYTLGAGTLILTGDWEVGQVLSDGTWSWKE